MKITNDAVAHIKSNITQCELTDAERAMVLAIGLEIRSDGSLSPNVGLLEPERASNLSRMECDALEIYNGIPLDFMAKNTDTFIGFVNGRLAFVRP